VAELLWRMLKRIRPREGWLIFLLTWGALLGVAMGIVEARWERGGEFRLFLVGVALVGGFTGFGLARSRWVAWRAAVLGALSGVVYIANAVGRVLPPWAQLTAEFGYLAQWLRQGWSGGPWGQIPFQSLLADGGRRLALLGGRLARWWTIVRGGEVGQDNAPFLLLIGLALWAAAVFAMWGVYRWRRPLVGLMPGAAILAVSVYLSDEGLSYLLGVLACGAFLVPWVHLMALAESWERRGVDYSPEVRIEVFVVGLALACLVVLGGVVVPSVSIPQVARWAWEHWPDTWKSTDEGVWRTFGDIRRPEASAGGVPVGSAGLPRAHLLGGAADLTRQPVMTVTTGDPPMYDPAD
jgi:hypothetical protein